MIVVDHIHQLCPKRSPGTERLVLHQCKPLSVFLPDLVSELPEFGRKPFVDALDLRGGEFDQAWFDVVGVRVDEFVVVADQFIDVCDVEAIDVGERFVDLPLLPPAGYN
jgi:hypothetical protein